MRLLIAARLSKDTGPGQTGIDSQDLRMRVWAESEGHEVVAVVADKVSGRRAPWKRPNLRLWVTDAGHMVQYEAIAAYALDRLTRGNDAETTEIEAWAREHGKKLLVLTGGLEYPCEGNASISWDVAKRMAHQEWLNTSERTKRGIGYLRNNAYLTGALPWGYMAVESGDHKTVMPDPDLAPVIRELFQRYMAGATTLALCELLNAAGHSSKTGGPWVPRSMSRWLQNPILAGRYCDQKGRTILRVAPVLSAVEREALMRRMAERVAPGKPRGERADMLLGVLLCAHCDDLMRGRKIIRVRVDGTRKVNEYYRCDGSALNPSRCRNMVRRDRIEGAVNHWFNTEDFSLAEFTERTVIPGDTHQAELSANAAEMAALIVGQDDMPADIFVDKLSALRAERDRIKALPPEAPQVAVTGTGITIRQRWAQLDDSARRQFLIDAGYLIKSGHGFPRVWMIRDGERIAEALEAL